MFIDIQPPEVPQKGPRWLRQIFADLIDFTRRARVCDFNGSINQTPDGLSLGLGPGSAGGSGPLPFTIEDASDESGPKVRIFTSTVTGKVPSGFSPGDTPPYLLTVSDGDIIYLSVQCLLTDVPPSVDSVTISSASSIPADNPSYGGGAYGLFNIRLGSVAVSAGVVTAANDRFGPIDFHLFRNPFVAVSDSNAWNKLVI